MLAVLERGATVNLEKTRQRVRDRLALLQISANDASRRASLGISYVNDLLNGKSKNPVPHRLAQLAVILECDLEYLTGEQNTPRSTDKPAPRVDVKSDPTMPLFVVGLPDPDGFFSLNDETQHSIPLSAPYAASNAYAVVVPDDSNAPRYFAGELVIVSPNQPVSRGGFAVIRMKDGRATIRRVDAIRAATVEASTVEDGEAVQIDRSDIDSVHKIVGSSDYHR